VGSDLRGRWDALFETIVISPPFAPKESINVELEGEISELERRPQTPPFSPREHPEDAEGDLWGEEKFMTDWDLRLYRLVAASEGTVGPREFLGCASVGSGSPSLV